MYDGPTPASVHATASMFARSFQPGVQYFPLTTNQHKPHLSVQKPTSEQARKH